jgi:hypothetical protein
VRSARPYSTCPSPRPQSRARGIFETADNRLRCVDEFLLPQLADNARHPNTEGCIWTKESGRGRFGILNKLCLFRLSFWTEHLYLFCRFLLQ